MQQLGGGTDEALLRAIKADNDAAAAACGGGAKPAYIAAIQRLRSSLSALSCAK